jgi:hypothetical protein
MSQGNTPNVVVAPQAEPPRKDSILRILWNLKDYVTAAVGIYEFIKYVIEHGNSVFNNAIIVLVVASGIGRMAWSFVTSFLMIMMVIRIFQLVAWVLVKCNMLVKSRYDKISNAIEHPPTWLWLVIVVPAGLFGVIMVIGGYGDDQAPLMLAFAIPGAILVLVLFYRICHFIQKNVKVLTAE